MRHGDDEESVQSQKSEKSHNSTSSNARGHINMSMFSHRGLNQSARNQGALTMARPVAEPAVLTEMEPGMVAKFLQEYNTYVELGGTANARTLIDNTAFLTLTYANPDKDLEGEEGEDDLLKTLVAIAKPRNHEGRMAMLDNLAAQHFSEGISTSTLSQYVVEVDRLMRDLTPKHQQNLMEKVIAAIPKTYPQITNGLVENETWVSNRTYLGKKIARCLRH
jgi:hypothetical protein